MKITDTVIGTDINGKAIRTIIDIVEVVFLTKDGEERVKGYFLYNSRDFVFTFHSLEQCLGYEVKAVVTLWEFSHRGMEVVSENTGKFLAEAEKRNERANKHDHIEFWQSLRCK